MCFGFLEAATDLWDYLLVATRGCSPKGWATLRVIIAFFGGGIIKLALSGADYRYIQLYSGL